eukprot:1160717-Pelagomonas_calceolata.AAC.7
MMMPCTLGVKLDVGAIVVASVVFNMSDPMHQHLLTCLGCKEINHSAAMSFPMAEHPPGRPPHEHAAPGLPQKR